MRKAQELKVLQFFRTSEEGLKMVLRNMSKLPSMQNKRNEKFISDGSFLVFFVYTEIISSNCKLYTRIHTKNTFTHK